MCAVELTLTRVGHCGSASHKRCHSLISSVCFTFSRTRTLEIGDEFHPPAPSLSFPRLLFVRRRERLATGAKRRTRVRCLGSKCSRLRPPSRDQSDAQCFPGTGCAVRLGALPASSCYLFCVISAGPMFGVGVITVGQLSPPAESPTNRAMLISSAPG